MPLTQPLKSLAPDDLDLLIKDIDNHTDWKLRVKELLDNMRRDPVPGRLTWPYPPNFPQFDGLIS